MPREIVALPGAQQFRHREYELPPLGDEELRVHVTFAAPKHGTELHSLTGSVFDRKQWDPQLRLFLPRTGEPLPPPRERAIGNMVVGTVIEVGSQVSRFRPGDRVYGYGPVREVHQAPAGRWLLLDGLSESDAVCTDPAHVAFVAVRDGRVRLGDDVAVFGLGAIGLLTVQAARAGGARRVIAVDPAARRRACAAVHGATATLDPTTTDVALAIKEATDGAGVDVALETSGSSRALHEAIRCLRQCGTVVHVPWGPRSTVDLHLDEEFHLNRPTLIASQAVWQNPDRDHPLWNEQRARATAASLFREGLLTGEGIVTPVLDFEEAPRALTALLADPDAAIKVGVRMVPAGRAQ